VCYVLDEPTIGLHPRDNRLLLDALGQLAQGRNTLVVVEHDEETIRRADHVLDLGPGAGSRGGHIVASGTVKQIMASPQSLTGRYLREPMQHAATPRRRGDPRRQCHAHAAHRWRATAQPQGIDVELPVGRLIALTGVSGSGKSTLAMDILHPELAAHLARPRRAQAATATPSAAPATRTRARRSTSRRSARRPLMPGHLCGILGCHPPHLRRHHGSRHARLVGQSLLVPIRPAVAARPARAEGLHTVEMNFLPDVKVLCDACRGARFDFLKH
jgi:excinuclease ABC subunit A